MSGFATSASEEVAFSRRNPVDLSLDPELCAGRKSATAAAMIAASASGAAANI